MAEDPRITALKQKLTEEAERKRDVPGAMLRREVLFDKLADDLYDALMEMDDLAEDADRTANGFRAELSRRFAPKPPAKARPTISARSVAAKTGAKGGGKPRDPLPLHLLTSPYRFVELNDTVVKAPEKPELHKPMAGGFTGRISVEWAVETPLLIGEERPENDRAQEKTGKTSEGVIYPMRLGGPTGPYVIPGATLKGMIRASAEIVAGGRLSQINGHHRYGLRDFTHPLVKPEDETKSILHANKIKAGWLHFNKETNIATITPCQTWRRIRHKELYKLIGKSRIPNEYDWRSQWLATPIVDRYAAAGFKVAGGKEPRIDFEDVPAQRFRVSGGPFDGFADPDPLTGEPGCLVFSNRSPAAPPASIIEQAERRGGAGQPKKNEYVFFNDPLAVPFRVHANAWDRFWLINTKPARRKRQPDGSFAALSPTLEKGKPVPVFYVFDKNPQDESLQFGLTRFFKIAHTYSVRDLLNREKGNPHSLPPSPDGFNQDLVEALFGHVLEKEDFASTAKEAVAQKGRLAFGFAMLVNSKDATELEQPIETIMGAPRASFAPFYLQGLYKDYSYDGARLAGRKRYVPRFLPQDLEAAPSRLFASLRHQISRLGRDAKQLREVTSQLQFLRHKEAGGELLFSGDIRVRNVSAVELGLLLWVITHGDPAKPCRHQLGRAKQFGAGQTRLKSVRLHLRPHDEGAAAMLVATDGEGIPGPDSEGWTPRGPSIQPFLDAFTAFMQQNWPKWPDVAPVQQWLRVSEPAYGALEVGQRPEPEGRFTYPDLKEFGIIRRAAKLDSSHPVLPKGQYMSALNPINEIGDTQQFAARYIADMIKGG